MPKLRTESWAADDFSWLGSAHGIWNARTVTLDFSSLTSGTHYPDGYVPSGWPLGIITATGLAAPYDSGGVDGTEVLAGFLYTAAKIEPGVTEDIPVPLLYHGTVKVANLPVAFTAPAAASNATTIVFI